MPFVEELRHLFTYHPPTANQIKVYEEIRQRAFGLAVHLSTVCPESRELSLALTKLEECVMHAISAIARRS